MTQPLHVITPNALTWKNTLPENFPGVRLPGGTVYSCIADFGAMCIQEFVTADYKIRYSFIQTNEQVRYTTKGFDEGVHSFVLLSGNLKQEINEDKQLSVLESQWWLLKAPLASISSETTAQKTIQKFAIWFSREFVEGLIPIFPFVQEYIQLNGNESQLPNTPGWVDEETLAYIQHIMKCSYPEQWRLDYFNSKVRDLLFKFFVRISTENPMKTVLSNDDVEKVQLAALIIKENLSKHLVIPELAKKVLMNEYQFKKVFKAVYGKGPYEYLRNERLQKATLLLEQGMFVKQVAIETGWRPADLIFAYKEKYGITPGKMKNRND